MLLEKPVAVQQSCSSRCLVMAALGFVTLAALLGGVGTRAKADGPTIIIINRGEKPKVITATPATKSATKSKKVVKLLRTPNQTSLPKSALQALKDAQIEVEVVVAPGAKTGETKKLFLLKNVKGDITLSLDPDAQSKKVKVIRVPATSFKPVQNSLWPNVIVVPPSDKSVRIWDFKDSGQGQLKKTPVDGKKFRVKMRLVEPKAKVIEQMVEKLKKAKTEKQITKIVKEMVEKLTAASKTARVVQFTPLRGQLLLPKSAKFQFHGSTGKVPDRGYLGVQLNPELSEALADQLGLPTGQGILLAGVVANSPAAKAGLKKNDVVVKIAGKDVPRDVQTFVKLVAGLNPKKAVDVMIIRKGKRKTIRGIKLGRRPTQSRVIVDEKLQQLYQSQLSELEANKLRMEQLQAALKKTAEAVERARAKANANAYKDATESYKKAVRVKFPPTKEVVLSVTLDGRKVTGRYQKDKLVITAKGIIQPGQSEPILKINSIVIQDGQQVSVYSSVDKVPTDYADEMQKLRGAITKAANLKKS